MINKKGYIEGRSDKLFEKETKDVTESDILEFKDKVQEYKTELNDKFKDIISYKISDHTENTTIKKDKKYLSCFQCGRGYVLDETCELEFEVPLFDICMQTGVEYEKDDAVERFLNHLDREFITAMSGENSANVIHCEFNPTLLDLGIMSVKNSGYNDYEILMNQATCDKVKDAFKNSPWHMNYNFSYKMCHPSYMKKKIIITEYMNDNTILIMGKGNFKLVKKEDITVFLSKKKDNRYFVFQIQLGVCIENCNGNVLLKIGE